MEGPSGPLTGRPVQRRRLALLALLAVARTRGVGRDKLIGYLWPESSKERARHLLSDSVYVLNKALGADALFGAGDELRLDPERIVTDVGAFQDALDAGERERAAGLYAGPLLDGFFLPDAPEFERWVDVERERLSGLYAGALDSLSRERASAGDLPGAASWLRRLAAHDPYNARVALRLVQALDAAGERLAALRHAQVHAALLRAELGVDPDPEVVALAERLRSEPAPPAPVTAPPGPARETGPAVIPEVETAPPGFPPRRPRSGRGIRLGSAAVLVVLLMVLGAVWARREEPLPESGSASVAVLRFADHSPAGDHAYFSNGMTEELISALTRVEGLRVVAPSTASPLDEQDVQALGRRLRVEAVLEGSVSRWGDSIRINARLVRVEDRSYSWSDSYTSELSNVFAIQDSISRAIVSTLRVRLVGGGGATLAEPSTADFEAYNLYLRGRYAWHRRTKEGLASAVDYFQQAVARAPGYARAHAGLADAYAVQGFYDHRPPREAFPAAENAARRALALDPTLAQPHATVGYVNLYFHWRWTEAEEAFRRSIELDPGYSTAHQWYANHLTAMGRFGEAEREMRRAMELDPLSLVANAALGWVHYYAGDYARAVEQCRRTLELDDRFQLAYLWSGLAYERMGRPEEAVRMLERALELSPESAITVAALAHANAGSGRTGRARDLLDRLLSSPGGYVPSFEVAKVYLALGDTAQALEWLETAYEQRSHSMAFLRVDPQLAPLRADPRFRALLQRAGHTT